MVTLVSDEKKGKRGLVPSFDSVAKLEGGGGIKVKFRLSQSATAMQAHYIQGPASHPS